MYTYKMEYQSTIKKNGTLPLLTTWMDLGEVMPSEITHTEKDKHCMISPPCEI